MILKKNNKFKNLHEGIELNKKNNIILLLLVTIFNINFSIDWNLFKDIFIPGIIAYGLVERAVYATNDQCTVNTICGVPIGVSCAGTEKNLLATFKAPLILPVWLCLFYLRKI